MAEKKSVYYYRAADEEPIFDYLNNNGRPEIHGDNSVSFHMNDGGLIVPFDELRISSSSLLVYGCSDETHGELDKLCNKK